MTAQKDRGANTQQSVQKGEVTGSDLADLERLRKAGSTWDGDRTQLQQQLASATDRATKSQQAVDALRKTNEDLQARLAAETAAAANRPADAPLEADASPGIVIPPKIYGLLAEYQLAYEELDAAAVARLVPSASAADLTRSFSQLRSYR